MKKLKIMPEFGCWPIWLKETGFYENVPVDSVGLSSELTAEIKQWDLLFQETYDKSIPQDSGFSSDIEESNFVKRGQDIKRQVQSELEGVYTVLLEI